MQAKVSPTPIWRWSTSLAASVFKYIPAPGYRYPQFQYQEPKWLNSALKNAKIAGFWGFAPDPTRGGCSSPPGPPASSLAARSAGCLVGYPDT